MPNDMPPARKRTSNNVPQPEAGAPRRRPTTAGQQRAAPKPAGAKLVCTAGPKTGTEFPLDADEMVIGRAAENLISIPDTSVSRRHVVLRRNEEGWAASDMGSGNGTLLNGEPMTEETVLRNGDTLVLGDTELVFADVENSTDKRALPAGRRGSMVAVPVRREGVPARAPTGANRPRVVTRQGRKVDPEAQKRKRRMTIYGGLFLVIALGLFVGVKVKAKGQAEIEAHKARIEMERRAQLAAIFQDGKNLVRAGNWKEAKGKFQEVKELAPSYPGIDDYLARAEKEIPNQEALAEVEAALKENKIGPAATALAKVSGDTQLFTQVRTLKAQLDDKVQQRIVEARQALDLAAKVSTAKDVSKYDDVIAITSDLLSFYSDNRDAKVMKEQAETARAELTTVKPPPPPPPSRPWEGAINLFVDGDLTGAFSVANACSAKHARCKALVSQMSEFQSLYKKVEDLDAKGLGQLLSLDSKIADGRMSKMAKS
ncbi:MAG TPA: FHA domain-containing protein, partial [Myxococcaceae bacterium]|nr:FHA domain-containing protein [Myxococcaceae bacterium]